MSIKKNENLFKILESSNFTTLKGLYKYYTNVENKEEKTKTDTKAKESELQRICNITDKFYNRYNNYEVKSIMFDVILESVKFSTPREVETCVGKCIKSFEEVMKVLNDKIINDDFYNKSNFPKLNKEVFNTAVTKECVDNFAITFNTEFAKKDVVEIFEKIYDECMEILIGRINNMLKTNNPFPIK